MSSNQREISRRGIRQPEVLQPAALHPNDDSLGCGGADTTNQGDHRPVPRLPPGIGSRHPSPSPVPNLVHLPPYSPLESVSVTPFIQENPLARSLSTNRARLPELGLQPHHQLGDKLAAKFNKSKIRLVSTSVSSFEDDSSTPWNPGPSSSNLIMTSMDDSRETSTVTLNYEQQSQELRNMMQLIRDHLEDLQEEDIDLVRLPTAERDLDRIQTERDKFRCSVRDFLEENNGDLDSATANAWKDCITIINNEVKSHARKIRAKVQEISPPMSSFETQQIHIQLRQLSLMEANASRDHDSQVTLSQNQASKTLALAKRKYDAFFEDSSSLLDITVKHPKENLSDPDKYSDQAISKFMREVSGLKSSLRDLTKNYNAFLELTVTHRLEEALMHRIGLEMENTRNEINDFIKIVEKEDTERNIRTLDSSKAEQRKFKKFSGEPGEDLLYFKKDFEECVVANRISRSNQLEKLRECLAGEALKQIPKNMTGGILAAWQSLKSMFGDPERLLKFRLKALDDLGKFPPSLKGGQPNYVAQTAWLAPFLVEVSEIISLGESYKDIENTVFNTLTINNIISRFSEKDDLQTLDLIGGRDKEKLLGIKSKLETMKAKTLRFSARTMVDQAKTNKDSKDIKNVKPVNAVANNIGEVKGMTIYRSPQRFSECRICDLYVGFQNPPANLHENHLSDWVTGCPVFMELSTVEKFRKAREAEFCIKCFDKDIKYNNGAHMNKESDQIVPCYVTKETKHRYSCLDKTCLNHMWICRKHKKLNEETMKKQQTKLKKSGASLNFTVGVPSSPKVVHANQQIPGLPEYSPTNLIREQVDAMTLPNASIKNKPLGRTGKSKKEFYEPLTRSPPLKQSRLQKGKSTQACRSKKTLLFKEKMKMKGSSDFIPVPNGAPMFMFQGVEGKTRSTNWFYDSGCSYICMKNEIPVKEYNSTLLKKGPFYIGGVGGIKVVAHNEYLISVPRADKRMQHFQGVTVDNITTEFPIMNLETATAELKEADINNDELQGCFVPPSVGGHVDVLVGIMYSSSFPTLVHMLDSGLGIYKCKLSSHNKQWNALVGGPHESFNFLAQKSGNVAHLLNNFKEGLKVFRTSGPPKLSRCPMTVQEELFAKSMNAMDTDMKEIRDIVAMEAVESSITEYIVEESENSSQGDSAALSDRKVVIYCQDCSSIDLRESKMNAMLSEESVWDLKGFMRQVENTGLDVEYRCVRCRSCADCRNADESDKISLRQEQELQQCMDSVQLDKENKKIIVSLPLRGEEREFLVSNKDMAEQILNQQCKKYSSDSETKEMILKAFAKMFQPGFLVLMDDLETDIKKLFSEKEVQYYIPWRIQFKESVSTPARPVFDASTKTKRRGDGTGGKCLNDLVCKGVVRTLNLVKLLLRFCVGRHAISADIKQFYNAGKLLPNQWNLQRFLYKEDMDVENETKEGVITTLIYGVTSASCQSECFKSKLAESIREEKPSVAVLLTDSTFVDDLGESKDQEQDCINLMADTDQTLASVGTEVKAWVRSGYDPEESVSKDGVSIDVGGMRWFAKLDLYEVKIPILHFGKFIRGKLKQGTKLFEGDTVTELDDFIPNKLTKRQVTSKVASIFDPRGKLAPVLAEAKVLLRLTNSQTVGWDDPIPTAVRNKWILLFMKFEYLRGIKFHRPIMPEDAINTKMRILTGADAAESVIMVGAWGGFQRKDGSWSCQHLLGRNLLAGQNSTIPKLELEGLTGAANMGWIISRALNDWIDSSAVFSDSRIALCWTTSENRRLGIFHRSRVLQIKRSTHLGNLFHVRTDHNPCDTGTRPEKVTLDSVGPESTWERGADWMQDNLEEAAAKDIIKPALELRLNTDEENKFNEGCVYEKPEVLSRGHVVQQDRVSKIEERAKFSKYLLMPTKFSFTKVVRIYGYIIKFARSCCRNRRVLQHLLSETRFQFSVFPACSVLPVTDQPSVSLSDADLSMSLTYLYQKGSMEVKEFNTTFVVKKYTVEKDGILYSRSRLIDGMDVTEAGGLKLDDLGELGLTARVPVLDRFSPLSYSVANHVHWNLCKHKGMETCNRTSLQRVHILGGPTLYKEIGEECIRCKMKRKKFIEVSMGPVSQHQLSVAPPMWAAQVDLFGPCTVYVPGFERQTRARKALATEVNVMVFACPSTRLVNLQVIEGKDAGCIIDGITRMSCEVGIPKYLMIDDDDCIKKALRELEVDVRDLKHQLHSEKGIVFEICPVHGHNQHGQVERVIKSIKESLQDCGIKTLRVHATGLQTFLKLVENTYNNAPLGYSHGRDADNGPILKTISPNMLRMGRNNERALEGNIRFPVGGYEMVEKVEKLYQAWYKLWKVAVVPKLIRQPKWFKTDKHLKAGDLVYFEKDSGKATSVWIMGRVDQVITGQDGLVREATVAYRNFGENFNRLTNRAARSLVRIFSIDEGCIQEDLSELQKRIDKLRDRAGDDAADQDQAEDGLPTQHQVTRDGLDLQDDGSHQVPPATLVRGKPSAQPQVGLHQHLDVHHSREAQVVLGLDHGQVTPCRSVIYQVKESKKKLKACSKCCCPEHCRVTNHNTQHWKKATELCNPFTLSTMVNIQDDHYEYEEENYEDDILSSQDSDDGLTSVLMSINLKL